MKYIKNSENYIIEQSIGSENIRNKYYSDLSKSVYYSIVNLDPTSVRKKNFSKPGKYVKWLIYQYKNPVNVEFKKSLNDEEYRQKINKYLFIFSTQWYKSHSRVQSFFMGGEEIITKTGKENDILRLKSIYQFEQLIKHVVGVYGKETEDAKFEVIYSDDTLDILLPINFTASYQTAKNTEWCSQQYSGFSMFNKNYLLIRIIPNNTKYDKVKITWNFNDDNNKWYISGSKYPEVSGDGNPFNKEENGKEKWENKIEEYIHIMKDTKKYQKHFKKMENTMSLLNDSIKKKISDFFYNKVNKK